MSSERAFMIDTKSKWSIIEDINVNIDEKCAAINDLVYHTNDDRIPEFIVSSLEKDNEISGWVMFLVDISHDVVFSDKCLQTRLKNILLFIAKKAHLTQLCVNESLVISSIKRFFTLVDDKEAVEVTLNFSFMESPKIRPTIMGGLSLIFSAEPPLSYDYVTPIHNLMTEIVTAYTNKWILTPGTNTSILFLAVKILSITGYSGIDQIIEKLNSLQKIVISGTVSWILKRLKKDLTGVRAVWTSDPNPVDENNMFLNRLDQTLQILNKYN